MFRIRFWTVLDGFGRFLGRSATVLQPLNSRGSAQHPGAILFPTSGFIFLKNSPVDPDFHLSCHSSMIILSMRARISLSPGISFLSLL